MKKILLSFILLFIAISATANGKWEILGNYYNIDTLSVNRISPNTSLTKLALYGKDSLRVYCLKTNFRDTLEVVKVIKGQNKVKGVQKLSSMHNEFNNDSLSLIVGVNADFFSMKAPLFP